MITENILLFGFLEGVCLGFVIGVIFAAWLHLEITLQVGDQR